MKAERVSASAKEGEEWDSSSEWLSVLPQATRRASTARKACTSDSMRGGEGLGMPSCLKMRAGIDFMRGRDHKAIGFWLCVYFGSSWNLHPFSLSNAAAIAVCTNSGASTATRAGWGAASNCGIHNGCRNEYHAEPKTE